MLPLYIALFWALPALALSLDCPDGGYEVTFKSPFGDKVSTWCQLNRNGQLIKHGMEVITEGGKSTTNIYKMGKLVQADVQEEKPKAKPKFKTVGLPGIAENQKEFTKKIIKKTYKRKWPSLYNYQGGVGYKTRKKKEVIKKELITFASALLGEIIHGKGPAPSDNIFYDAFSKVPGMDRDPMRSLAKHYLKRIKEGKFKTKEMKEKGILFPIIKEFQLAIRKRDLKEVRTFLINYDLAPDYTEKDNIMPPIIQASEIKRGSEILKMMMAKKPDLGRRYVCAHYKKQCGKKRKFPKCTPLDMAASYSDPISMEVLIEAGADINNTAAGTTPLIRAIMAKKQDNVKFLLDKAVDFNKKVTADSCRFNEHQSGNALAIAARDMNDQKMADFLLSNGVKLEDSNPKILSAIINYFPKKSKYKKVTYLDRQAKVVEKIGWLRSKGYDFKKKFEKSDMPIRIAAQKKYPNIIEEFLKYDPDLNRQDKEGRTPVFHVFDSPFWGSEKKPSDYDKWREEEDYMVKLARHQVIKVIFNNKGKRQIRDKYGKGLIHYATLEQPHNTKIIKYLKDKGSY